MTEDDCANVDAIRRARDLALWAKGHGFTVASVDPDVLGGISVHVAAATSERQIWFACMNSGGGSVVHYEGQQVVGYAVLDDEALKHAERFLTSGEQ